MISETMYTKDLIRKFNMQECKGTRTPMPTSGHVDLTKEDNPIDENVYRSMIGSLLYLCATSCRVFACVPDSKRHLKSVIYWLLKES